MPELILNDFTSFNRFLFGKYTKNRNWKKFKGRKNGRSGFVPPVNSPKTIEEYQLNHYTYWMFITHVMDGAYKPTILVKYPSLPISDCYACEYARRQRNRNNSSETYCEYCPVKSVQHYSPTCRNNEYILWLRNHNTLLAMAVARTLWNTPQVSRE